MILRNELALEMLRSGLVKEQRFCSLFHTSCSIQNLQNRASQGSQYPQVPSIRKIGSGQSVRNTVSGSERMSQETLGSAKHLCRLMREIGSYMPHPVVVVTAEAPPSHHIKPDPPVESGSQEVQTITSERKGITIGSFTTLSLSPYPLITFNIKRPSATLQAIQQSKKFSVHLLRGNEHGAQFAVDFSEKTRTKHGGDEERERRMQRLFDGKRTGGGNGIMGILECECEGEVIVKDHSILIGRVCKTHGAVNSLYTTWAGNYERRRVAQRIMPGGLSYMKREYRMVGRKVYPPQGRMHVNQEEDHLTEETPKKEMMLLKQLSKEDTPSQEEDEPSNKEEDRLVEEPPLSEDTPSSEEQTLLPEKTASKGA